MVHKTKHDSEGVIRRHKARLIAKGYAQTYGIDYEETFSSLAKMVTIRCLIPFAAVRKLIIVHMDAENAFLNGDLKDEVYMQQPPRYIYVWHAIIGYWGGVKPGAAAMEQFESTLTYPMHSPGILHNEPEMKVDNLTVNGLGFVNPRKAFNFYNELHSYLAEAGVDGVKVDAQSILETLGRGYGGRVLLTRQYQEALESSIQQNFPDNGCIACMSHHIDAVYSSLYTAVIRVSDDFWPEDPASHTIHVASVAYNSLFLGEIMQPDWDMFQSLHPAAEFHAAARAIGGCGIYVSDKPGKHNFDLLKKLVLPDGSILRAQLPGRPTRDCLFADPARDGCSLLKIWNMNKFSGILGAFNCQGAGWCKNEKKNVIHDQNPKELTAKVSASDVYLLSTVAEQDQNGHTIFYKHKTGELLLLPKDGMLSVTLGVLEYELFTIVPVKTLGTNIRFSPIGLSNMFNSGGAIESMEVLNSSEVNGNSRPTPMTPWSDYSSSSISSDIASPFIVVKLNVHGCGRFIAYSSQRPSSCTAHSIVTSFTYEEQTGSVSVNIPEVGNQMSHLTFIYSDF